MANALIKVLDHCFTNYPKASDRILAVSDFILNVLLALASAFTLAAALASTGCAVQASPGTIEATAEQAPEAEATAEPAAPAPSASGSVQAPAPSASGSAEAAEPTPEPSEVAGAAGVTLSQWSAAECDGFAVTQSLNYCLYHGCDGTDFDQTVWELMRDACEESLISSLFSDLDAAMAFTRALNEAGACDGSQYGAYTLDLAGDNQAPWITICPIAG